MVGTMQVRCQQIVPQINVNLCAQVWSSTQRRPSLQLDLCAGFPPTLPSRTLPRLTQCFEQEIDAARDESAIVTDLQDELQAA